MNNRMLAEGLVILVQPRYMGVSEFYGTCDCNSNL